MRIHTFEDDWWRRLYRPLVELPLDVTGMLLFVLVAAPVVLVPAVFPRPIRFLVGLPLLFFVPGYAIVAALFPARNDNSSSLISRDSAGFVRSIRADAVTDGERAAFAFGLSVVILVLVGLVLGASPTGLDRTPLLAVFSFIVVTGSAIATYRRRQLPNDVAYRVPHREWFEKAQAAIIDADSIAERLVNGFLLVSVVLALSTVAFALAVPPADGESYTEFYLVTENEPWGELVAGEYPTNLTQGESERLTFGVESYEQATTDYTVVVQLQRVRTEDTDITVLERHELQRFHHEVESREVWTESHDVRPSFVGDDLRLTYLLYTGEPPERPTMENADEHLFIWVDVSRSGA